MKFEAVDQKDKCAIQLAKDLSDTVQIWEHDIELNDGRTVHLMNVDFNGKEIWQVFAEAGKGKLIVTESG
jgi:hypothetical protein